MRPSAMFGLLNYRRRENRMLDTRHIYIELCLSLTKIRSAIDCHGLHNHPMDSTGKEECRAEMERVVVVNQHAFDYSKRKKNIINMPEHIQTNKIQLHSHCTCINSYMAWFAVHKLFHISVFFCFHSFYHFPIDEHEENLENWKFSVFFSVVDAQNAMYIVVWHANKKNIVYVVNILPWYEGRKQRWW